MTNLPKLKNDTTKTIKIGGHLSAAGGYHNALIKTKEIGGNSLQLFSSSPRNWAVLPPTQGKIDEFLKIKKELEIDPIYFHASYLVNLADPSYVGERSVETLIQELILSKKMDVKGTIVHLGSFKIKEPSEVTPEQFAILIKNIQTVLDNTPEDTLFIAENAGNKKIGWSLEELGKIIKEVHNPRLKICLDTCHFHAAGYDISTQEKFDVFFSLFDKEVGLSNLEVFQVNDSKDPLGSFRDRHENIGEGTIPQESFRLLLTDERTKDKPFLLEVPGENKEGPNKKNVTKLLDLIEDH